MDFVWSAQGSKGQILSTRMKGWRIPLHTASVIWLFRCSCYMLVMCVPDPLSCLRKKMPKLGILYNCATILKGFSIIRHEKCSLKFVRRNIESIFPFVSSIDFVRNKIVTIVFLIVCPLPTYGVSRIWFGGILMYHSKIHTYFMCCMMLQHLPLLLFL